MLGIEHWLGYPYGTDDGQGKLTRSPAVCAHPEQADQQPEITESG